MRSNELNKLDGLNNEPDELKKLGNRIKTLRIGAGHLNYEKFAYKNDIGRMLLRRAELGGNIKYTSLLKIIRALGFSAKEFFSEGFD